MQLTNIPTNAAGLALVGTSRTSWGGIPLPLDLTSIGMPGCSLFTRGTFLFAIAASGGTANLTLPLPNDCIR